jgi:hypothetical protein
LQIELAHKTSNPISTDDKAFRGKILQEPPVSISILGFFKIMPYPGLQIRLLGIMFWMTPPKKIVIEATPTDSHHPA